MAAKQTRESVLFFAKGHQDKAWLKHLVNEFSDSSTRFVAVKCGFDTSPTHLVCEAIRQTDGIEYDKVVIIMDQEDISNDREGFKAAKSSATKHKMDILIIKSCMESLQLHVLEPEKGWTSKTKTLCKKHLEGVYIAGSERSEAASYTKSFPKELIEKGSESSTALKNILDHIRP